MAFNADSAQCPHPDVHIELNHQMMADSNVHYLEVKVRCRICEAPMAFRGLPFGVSPHHPTMAIDGSEITLPFLGAGEEPAGKLIGFVGKQVGQVEP